MATINYNEKYSNIKDYGAQSTTTEIKKEIEMEQDIEPRWDTLLTGVFSNMFNSPKLQDELKPERVIYNGRTTICMWKDGTKTIVKATGDDFMTHEHGVAMAVIRKLFSSRQEFLRVVNGGYDVIEEAKERAIEKTIRKIEAETRKQKAEARKKETEALKDFGEVK